MITQALIHHKTGTFYTVSLIFMKIQSITSNFTYFQKCKKLNSVFGQDSPFYDCVFLD